ncbi:MAG TPA: winged helix-turn-helix domain-containing protein [Polyangiaceae bacterium]|jgi:predicted ATPase/DNA-binding winged helix-turn-helix (wHTH) protein|nr:winged helix-turn-helix domain-containing protein [Polyangiaceae bacterium]
MSIEQGTHDDHGAGEFAGFGPFRLFPTARRLERDGLMVELGGRALDILIELVRQEGRVIGKTELMLTIWGNTTVVEGVVRTHVCSLRKALGDGVSGARYITSVAGRGYCFVAPVVRGAIDWTAPPGKSGIQISRTVRKVGLPPPLARMAGRQENVRAISAQLLEHRFVSIVGAAGIGKTTIAVSIVHTLLDHFEGAVYFIELGSMTDPTLVVATVASTLGIPVHTKETLLNMQAFLQDKRVLLVLDNCEHVANEAARLAEHLFVHAAGVHLLTTSREALRVEGERVHRLGPLATPADHAGISPDAVQTFPAVQVFLERGAASGWSGELTDENAPIVAQICRRLDGVALALELTASFLGECGLKGTAAMLDDRLRLLWQHGRRTAHPRQQTLHALISWSYDRLLERERMVLRRLSIFVGTFSIDAAETVVPDAGDSGASLLEILNDLVSKSLLSSAVEDGSIVYRLLETTRVYALERLAEGTEFEQVSFRHASFFAERLEQAGAEEGADSHSRQAVSLGNVRAALEWSFSQSSGHPIGARLAGAAAPMLLALGLVTECHQWCRRALDGIGPPNAGTIVELRLQEVLGHTALYVKGPDDEVRAALTRGLELARALGGGDQEIRLLASLSIFLIMAGDYKTGLEIAREGEHVSGLGTAGKIMVHYMLSIALMACGHPAQGQSHAEEFLSLATRFGKLPTMAFEHTVLLQTLARSLWLQGKPDQALKLVRRNLTEVVNVTEPAEKCMRLAYSAQIYAWCGEWGEAEGLLDVLADHIERYSLVSHRGMAMALRGELLVKTGQPEEGCNLLRAADSEFKRTGNTSLDTTLASALAEGLAAVGAIDEALRLIGEAVELTQRRGGTWDQPDLLRLQGCFLASRSPPDTRAADETLRSAVELARHQGALAWELRAATALARERLRRGGTADDLSELAAIYAKFTEGFKTPDLQEARALLEQPVLRRTPRKRANRPSFQRR